MKRVVSAEEMRSFEQELFESGMASSLDWMERAAEGVDRVLAERYPGLPVLAVCAGGNNGGDGFALLRLLKASGVPCKGILLADPTSLKGDAKTNYLRALDCGVKFETELSPEALDACGVIVDAMFGTGLKYPLTGVFRDAAEQINACGKPVVAVDIPSGVFATTGAVSPKPSALSLDGSTPSPIRNAITVSARRCDSARLRACRHRYRCGLQS